MGTEIDRIREALEILLFDSIERRIGEHDMMRCKVCGAEGHNELRDGNPYAIKHKNTCTVTNGWEALVLAPERTGEAGLREALEQLKAECNQRYETFGAGDTQAETYLISAAYAWCAMEIDRALAATPAASNVKETPMTENCKYRVVETANPYVSPFPGEQWDTREKAEKFANEDAPDGWAGKLTVVEVEP